MMLVFAPFTALALNNRVAPICREVLTEGFRVIFAGKGEAPGGLWPPQPGKNNKDDKDSEIAMTTATD